MAFSLAHEAKAARHAFALIAEALDQQSVIMEETDEAILAAMLLDVVEGLTKAASMLTPLARRAAHRAVAPERIARQVAKELRDEKE